MTARTTAAGMAVAVTALALAACGGGGGSGGDGKSDRERMQEYALNTAECLRRHGIDVPDPTPGQDPRALIDKRDVDPQRFDRARRACRQELGEPPGVESGAEEERAVREAALRFARCMRAQGIDMPDPTFGANGMVSIEVNGLDVEDPEDDPAFKAADDQCRKYRKAPESRQGNGG
jgi:hypothetical protein